MYEGFRQEVKTFFVRGLMFPNEEVFSSALVHGAVGSVRCSSPLGAVLHSGIASSLCLPVAPVTGVFVGFRPPHRPPRIRMVDAIARWVNGEMKDTTTTRWTGWRAHGRGRRRRLRIRNRWRR